MNSGVGPRVYGLGFRVQGLARSLNSLNRRPPHPPVKEKKPLTRYRGFAELGQEGLRLEFFQSSLGLSQEFSNSESHGSRCLLSRVGSL